MEPLVIVSALVVLYYGYRTVIDVIGDVESDGSWQMVQESLGQMAGAASSLCQRLYTARRRKLLYYNNFLDTRKRHPRGMLLKPHA